MTCVRKPSTTVLMAVAAAQMAQVSVYTLARWFECTFHRVSAATLLLSRVLTRSLAPCLHVSLSLCTRVARALGRTHFGDVLGCRRLQKLLVCCNGMKTALPLLWGPNTYRSTSSRKLLEMSTSPRVLRMYTADAATDVIAAPPIGGRRGLCPRSGTIEHKPAPSSWRRAPPYVWRWVVVVVRKRGSREGPLRRKKRKKEFMSEM